MSNNMCQCGFTQTRRAEYQHVIESFLAGQSSTHKDVHLLTNQRLTDVVLEATGANGTLNSRFLRERVCCDEAILLQLQRHHLAPSNHCFSAKRTSSSLEASGFCT